MNNRILICGVLCLTVLLTRAVSADEPSKKMTDAEITAILVGKWSEEIQTDKLYIKGVTSFNKDGTFKSEATYVIKEEVKKIKGSGTWDLTEGVLVETIESSDPPVIEKGKISREKILSCSEKEITIKTEDGQESVMKKVED